MYNLMLLQNQLFYVLFQYLQYLSKGFGLHMNGNFTIQTVQPAVGKIDLNKFKHSVM